jgi:flavin-dependent dehydrogenase
VRDTHTLVVGGGQAGLAMSYQLARRGVEHVVLVGSLPLAIQLSPSVLLILLPLVVIELGLVAFSLIDLFKPERRVIGDKKLVWALIIVLAGTIGPIVYLLAGRKQN